MVRIDSEPQEMAELDLEKQYYVNEVSIDDSTAQNLINEFYKALVNRGIKVQSVRHLDHLIWQYQSSKDR